MDTFSKVLLFQEIAKDYCKEYMDLEYNWYDLFLFANLYKDDTDKISED